MKRISLPKPLAVPKITRNRRVCRACTTLGSVLLWFSVISLLGQATGACLSCNVPSANISTAIGVNAADHTIAEGLGKRNIAKSPSVIVLSAKPRITSPVHDQIYMGEDVRLTVEPGIEGKRCDLGRYQLVWLRAPQLVQRAEPFLTAGIPDYVMASWMKSVSKCHPANLPSWRMSPNLTMRSSTRR